MGRKLPLVLNLKEPCPMRWEDMLQAEAGRRFCQVCQKHVFDLSERSAEEIDELLRQRVCVNFEYRPDASIVTRAGKGRTLARVVMATALAALTGCGGNHNEDADYPRLGGAILPEDELQNPNAGFGEGGAGGNASSDSALTAVPKASCEH